MKSRMPLIDAFKGIAAQVIVLHHLASYGPIAHAMNQLLPAITKWFFEYGRMGVQVFLVVSGFLAARGFAPDGVPVLSRPLELVWSRYVRLMRPFLLAMLLAIAGAALARVWMQDEAIPGRPHLWQFVAHGLLLHGLFDVPPLSVGVWYVAIDFQLFVLLLLLMWLAMRIGRTPSRQRLFGQWLVGLLGIAALFHFNRMPWLDAWGIYFFGSYALGAMSYWLSAPGRPTRCMLILGAVGVAALLVDFRLRIALALVTAMLLGLARAGGVLAAWPNSVLLSRAGQISYSVFLVHFPVCLVANALFERYTDENAFAAIATVLLAWSASSLAGDYFYRHVESRRRWWPSVSAAKV